MSDKPKIEAIYPLSSLQKALLIHRLQGGKDEGFLHVQCRLSGPLQPDLLKESWQKAIVRHAALRTSIHWEKIEKPVQLVHPDAEMPWKELEWLEFSEEKQREKILTFKAEDEHEQLEFTKAPLSRMTLIRTGESEHLLVWTCHHILLDGWSAANIIRDVFAFYEAEVKGEPLRLESIPSYKTYLRWLKSQDQVATHNYWIKKFDGFIKPVLIAGHPNGLSNVNRLRKQHTVLLPVETTQALQAFIRKERITLNSFVQGVWGVLLGRYAGRQDIAFGTTVSGRTTDIPNMELLAGMFMNVLPVRVRYNGGEQVSEWMREFQAQQVKVRKYEHITLDEITSLLDWPGHQPLIDSLLVVENFPWNDIQCGELMVRDFKGGLTTTFPLTVIVIPGRQLKILFQYDTHLILDNTVSWLADSITRLFTALPDYGLSLNRLLAGVAPPPKRSAYNNGRSAIPDREDGQVELEHAVPRNATELQLARIWEQVLGLDQIGVNENFFEIGGTSLLAVRLFAEIENKTGRNLPPASLLQHPTIRSLARIMSSNQAGEAWNSLVPLRARGTKPPIFCIHAGGGHVFFYHAMARHLDSSQPVYAMQPVGMDGEKALLSNMEEIAAHYIKEMRAVQPEGPYALLGMCWSVAVCHEIVHQLESAGEKISLLAVVDSAPENFQPTFPPTPRDRFREFAGRFRQRPVHAVLHMLDNRVVELKKKWTVLKKSRQEQNLLRMQNYLYDLYNQYTWMPHNSKVTLIRCREFAEAVNGDWFMPQWEKLARGGVEVVDIPGHHHTLFEEPEVQELAKALQQNLDRAGRT